jgi:hypothetical protein
VILRALQKEPRRRYRTARELAGAYRQTLAAAREANELPVALVQLKERATNAILRRRISERPTTSAVRRLEPLGGMRGKMVALATVGLLIGGLLSFGLALQQPGIALPQMILSAGAQALNPAHEPSGTKVLPPTKQKSPGKSVGASRQAASASSYPRHTPPPYPGKGSGDAGDGGKDNGHGHGHGNGNGDGHRHKH